MLCQIDRKPVSLDRARRAKTRLQTQLKQQTGVQGVFIARAGLDYVLKVNILAADVCVPPEMDGVRVTSEVVTW